MALNHFDGDTPAEIAALQDYCAEQGVQAVLARHWAMGGAGAEDLARAVVALAEQPAAFAPLYPDAMPLWDKIQTVCTHIHRAARIRIIDEADILDRNPE